MMNFHAPLLKNQPVSDEELARLAQNGKQDAFIQLYERYFQPVLTRVRFRVPESDAEDVAQEVFIAVLRSLDKFKGQAKFSAWLWSVTNHKIADYYRSRKSKWIEEDEFEEVMKRSPGNDTTEDEENRRAELAAVRCALETLPPNYREVIFLRFADEMPFKEIALQTGQSLEAVKSLFRRSIAALGKRMEGNHES
jgi:RNA polymerase sigma-70 factor (ECF subfamily)